MGNTLDNISGTTISYSTDGVNFYNLNDSNSVSIPAGATLYVSFSACMPYLPSGVSPYSVPDYQIYGIIAYIGLSILPTAPYSNVPSTVVEINGNFYNQYNLGSGAVYYIYSYGFTTAGPSDNCPAL